MGVADRSAAGAQETLAHIAAFGGRAEALVFDLTDDAALIAAFDGFIACHGQIDILHDHAGAQVASMPFSRRSRIGWLAGQWNIRREADTVSAAPVPAAERQIAPVRCRGGQAGAPEVQALPDWILSLRGPSVHIDIAEVQTAEV